MHFLLAIPWLVLPLSATPIECAAAFQAEKPAENPTIEPGTSRAWALLTCAVLFERNGDRHDLLAGTTLDEKSVADTKKLLEKSWEITTPAQLLEQLEWLRSEGDRVEFTRRMQEFSKLSKEDIDRKLTEADDADERREIKALWENAPRVRKLKGGLLAWDLGRYVALCRWGYAAGLLSEQEAWKRIEPVAKDLQKAYASWEELGEAYCIGRECWAPGENVQVLAAFERLKMGAASPFKATPWKLRLGKLDQPEKRPEPKKKT